MPTPRPRQAAATTGPEGRIYIGGDTRSGQGTVEVYTPSTKKWATAATLPTARWDLAAVAGSDGHIYALGGRVDDTTKSVATVEVYDPGKKTWTKAANMNVARSSFAVVATDDGHIYVMGGAGEDGSKILGDVELFTIR